MALMQIDGQVSFNDIRNFFGFSSTLSLNDGVTRALATKLSGIISLTDLYGKSAQAVNIVISGNTTTYNLYNALTALGWNGTEILIGKVTINSNVYVSSTSTSTPAFTTGGIFPANSYVEIINNGYILGRGGNGGAGGATNSNGSAGTNGGPAFTATTKINIINNSIIGGGGGGGGGGGARTDSGYISYYYGGGGGGGAQTSLTNTSGGAGGAAANGGGAAGTNGTSTARGVGGTSSGGAGGAGGTWGAAGSSGTSYTYTGGAGGLGGACTTGSANITWIKTGTRYGGII